MQDTTEQTPVESAFEFHYKLGNRSLQFNCDDIVALRASLKYTEVVLRNSPILPIWNESLKTLMSDERFKHDFVYVHRATLVRMADIFSVDREPASSSNYSIVLDATDGQPTSPRYRFVISRRYYGHMRRTVAARNTLTAPA